MHLKKQFFILTIISLAFLLGCAGREFAPKKGVWYYPTELVQADQAVKNAKAANKDAKCPVEFGEAKGMKKKAYETYLACNDAEAKEMAQKATKMANALCPAKPKKPEKVIDKMSLQVNFDLNKSDIRESEKKELKKAIDFVNKYPKHDIKIAGHTCDIGSAAYNQKLSERRAEAVKKYLMEVGKIDGKRMTAVGYGKTKPAYSNKTAAGKAKNRRVEILIMGD
jgi:outer membrane protein OmpA-like peptidoglycan-associated protein